MRRARFVLGLLLSSAALAGNDRSFFMGDEAAIAGGAVTATSRGGEAAWYNPAGLGANTRSHVELTGLELVFKRRRLPDALVTRTPSAEVSEDLDGTRAEVVAPAAVLAGRIRPGLSAAFGVFVSEQDTLRLSGGRTVEDGATRFSQYGEIVEQQQRYHMGPAVGWQVHSRLRLGLSLFGVYESVDRRTTFAVTAVDEATEPPTLIAGSGTIRDAPIRVALEGAVGLQWEAFRRIHVGIAVRSPRYQVKEYYDATAVIGGGVATPEQEPLVEGSILERTRPPAGAGLVSPFRGTLSFAYTWNRGFVAVEGDYSPAFSAFEDAAFVFLLQEPEPLINRRALWNVRAGGMRALTGDWGVGGGVFTDRSPERVPDTFPEMQVSFYGMSFGARNRKTLRLTSGQRADSIVLSTTVAFRYAIGLGQASNVVFDLSDLTRRLRIPGESNIDVHFHEVAVHLGTALRF